MTKPQDIDAQLLRDIASDEGSLAQRVYLAIKQAILSLDFPPGATLRKAPICKRLGVSRAPVTEAIARLAAEGLVDVVPQSGTRVSYFSMPEIREGMFLREALELATVAKVARDLTEDQRKKLSRNMPFRDRGEKSVRPKFPEVEGLPTKLVFGHQVFGMKKVHQFLILI